MVTIPSEPIKQEIETYFQSFNLPEYVAGREPSKIKLLADQTGVSYRRISGIMSGEFKRIEFNTADKIICSLPEGPIIWYTKLEAIYPSAEDFHVKRGYRKNHCKRNHPLSGSNLRIAKSGQRRCRKCDILRKREARRLKNAA